MRRILRIIMAMMKYAPIATVAIAAHAKANELDGEAQNERIHENIKGARHRLLPTLQMYSTIEAARRRYAHLTGLQGDELESAMAKDLDALVGAGLLQFDEKFIMAAGPSEHSSSGA